MLQQVVLDIVFRFWMFVNREFHLQIKVKTYCVNNIDVASRSHECVWQWHRHLLYGIHHRSAKRNGQSGKFHIYHYCGKRQWLWVYKSDIGDIGNIGSGCLRWRGSWPAAIGGELILAQAFWVVWRRILTVIWSGRFFDGIGSSLRKKSTHFAWELVERSEVEVQQVSSPQSWLVKHPAKTDAVWIAPYSEEALHMSSHIERITKPIFKRALPRFSGFSRNVKLSETLPQVPTRSNCQPATWVFSLQSATLGIYRRIKRSRADLHQKWSRPNQFPSYLVGFSGIFWQVSLPQNWTSSDWPEYRSMVFRWFSTDGNDQH